jgi:c-di-GMP-binding flagellar brake protein YcgR
MCALLLSVAVAGAASADEPSHADLARALRRQGIRVSAADIRAVHCHGFAEEPTEFRCAWRQRSAGGRWRRRGGYLAIDGDHWISID